VPNGAGPGAPAGGGPVLLRGTANLLLPAESALVAFRSVQRFGNWAGGRFELTEAALTFRMNALNRPFQADTADRVIPVGAIRAIQVQGVRWLVPTIWLVAGDRPTGLRCGPFRAGRLIDALCALRPDLTLRRGHP
jgi:hypothetical protein